MEPFEYRHIVRFSEVDQAGVVFFARYFEIAHSALEAFFDHIGWSFAKLFKAGEEGFPLVHAAADYQAPARLGDALTVRLTVSRLSTSSFTLRYEFMDAKGRPATTVSTSHVWVKLDTFQKSPLPENLKDQLKPYLLPESATD